MAWKASDPMAAEGEGAATMGAGDLERARGVRPSRLLGFVAALAALLGAAACASQKAETRAQPPMTQTKAIAGVITHINDTGLSLRDAENPQGAELVFRRGPDTAVTRDDAMAEWYELERGMPVRVVADPASGTMQAVAILSGVEGEEVRMKAGPVESGPTSAWPKPEG